MVRKTKMNDSTSYSNGKAQRGIGGRVAAFSVDVIELIELQFHMFVADLREGKSRLRMAVVMLVLGPVIAIAALPSLMWGIAAMLIEWAAWPAPVAYLVVGIVTLLLAGGLTWLGVKRLLASMNTITRSRAELMENISWVKSALMQRASPDQATK